MAYDPMDKAIIIGIAVSCGAFAGLLLSFSCWLWRIRRHRYSVSFRKRQREKKRQRVSDISIRRSNEATGTPYLEESLGVFMVSPNILRTSHPRGPVSNGMDVSENMYSVPTSDDVARTQENRRGLVSYNSWLQMQGFNTSDRSLPFSPVRAVSAEADINNTDSRECLIRPWHSAEVPRAPYQIDSERTSLVIYAQPNHSTTENPEMDHTHNDSLELRSSNQHNEDQECGQSLDKRPPMPLPDTDYRHYGANEGIREEPGRAFGTIVMTRL